jgi:hypothetical protein
VNLSGPDRQLCDRIFWKFRWKSFLFKSRVRTVRLWRPDGRTSATSNFHIRLPASGPMGMNVRTTILQHTISISAMHASRPWEAGVRTVEVESAISILVARSSGPRLTDVRTVIFELRFLPYLWVRLDRKPHRLDGVSIFPYLNLERIWSWSITVGRLDGLLRGFGWMQAGTEAFRYSVGFGRKDTSSGWMMLVCLASGRDGMLSGRMEQWTDGRPDGITRRPDGWHGIWNLLSFSQCRVFWKCSNKWNPCLQHLYT